MGTAKNNRDPDICQSKSSYYPHACISPKYSLIGINEKKGSSSSSSSITVHHGSICNFFFMKIENHHHRRRCCCSKNTRANRINQMWIFLSCISLFENGKSMKQNEIEKIFSIRAILHFGRNLANWFSMLLLLLLFLLRFNVNVFIIKHIIYCDWISNWFANYFTRIIYSFSLCLIWLDQCPMTKKKNE